MSGPTPVRPVTIIIDGVTHQGSYFVQESTVHVRSPLGTKATQVGRLSPEAVAKLLLSELVRATKIALIMHDNE
jgi:hypothetical protein